MSIERRTHPRHPVRVNVLVSMPDPDGSTAEFTAESSNLSLTGIQLACDGSVIAALLKQPKLPFTCTVAFTLPEHEHRFVLASQYVTYRRKSLHEFVLVVVFTHEDAEQKELLNALLSRKL
jgi:hypothetical protein